jgi:hypothetical protein
MLRKRHRYLSTSTKRVISVTEGEKPQRHGKKHNVPCYYFKTGTRFWSASIDVTISFVMSLNGKLSVDDGLVRWQFQLPKKWLRQFAEILN